MSSVSINSRKSSSSIKFDFRIIKIKGFPLNETEICLYQSQSEEPIRLIVMNGVALGPDEGISLYKNHVLWKNGIVNIVIGIENKIKNKIKNKKNIDDDSSTVENNLITKLGKLKLDLNDIYDNIIRQLEDDPKKHFIYVEETFLTHNTNSHPLEIEYLIGIKNEKRQRSPKKTEEKVSVIVPPGPLGLKLYTKSIPPKIFEISVLPNGKESFLKGKVSNDYELFEFNGEKTKDWTVVKFMDKLNETRQSSRNLVWRFYGLQPEIDGNPEFFKYSLTQNNLTENNLKQNNLKQNDLTQHIDLINTKNSVTNIIANEKMKRVSSKSLPAGHKAVKFKPQNNISQSKRHTLHDIITNFHLWEEEEEDGDLFNSNDTIKIAGLNVPAPIKFDICINLCVWSNEDNYVLYVVTKQNSFDQKVKISTLKRFSDFEKLLLDLEALDLDIKIPQLPSKHSFGAITHKILPPSLTKSFVDQRKKELENWLRSVCLIKELSSCQELSNFFKEKSLKARSVREYETGQEIKVFLHQH